MTDLQARLDRAITEARHRMLKAQRNVDIARGSKDTLYALDRRDEAVDAFAALVALRARLDEAGQHCDEDECARIDELTAEAERLMEDA